MQSLKPDKQIKNIAYSSKMILGKGSYGVVYLGKNLNSKELVAVKVIPKLNSVQQEFEIMKQLHCANIIQLLDVIHTANNTYIVTEYCNGPDLREHLKKIKCVPEEEAKNYLKQIVMAMKEIVNQGFIHRDIKPANIILHNNECKVSDFGFSRLIKSDQVMESLVGTPLYMSPQILNQGSYTNKCDIWSLGLIYYEMLFGVTPWPATNYLELLQKLRTQRVTYPRKVSAESVSFIEGCLQQEESLRFDWNQVFNHPLIKPRLSIFIDTDIPVKPHFITHRPRLQPVIIRERSCSTNKPAVELKVEPCSSTDCDEQEKKQAQYYVPKSGSNMRRTKSQLENLKPNLTEINKRLNLGNTPIQNIIRQTSTGKHFKNITNIFKKNDNKQTQLLTLLLNAEECEKDNHELQKYTHEQRIALLKHQLQPEEAIRQASQFKTNKYLNQFTKLLKY